MFLLEDNSNIQLYHCSDKNHNNEIFYPKRFDTASSRAGIESPEARICFSDYIQGCIRSICRGIYNFELYVHQPYNPEKIELYRPTKKEVYDVDITHEIWIRQPVKMKCIGKILIYDIDNNDYEDLEVSFSKSKRKEILRFYTYKYKWLNKYK